MARDVRTNASDYNDRCKYFKRIKDSQKYSDIPAGMFWSKDIVPNNETPQTLNGKGKGQRITITIMTMDCVSDLEVDDRILYSGEYWNVASITRNDANENKRFTNRARFETTIELER